MTHDPETGELYLDNLYGEAPGRERPDPKPLEIPSGMKRPETLAEQVQRLVRTQISEEAAAQGFETFEESEDFDVDDDISDPSTPYEVVFDPVLGQEISPAEFRANQVIYRKRYDAVGKRITKKQLFDALGVDPDAIKNVDTSGGTGGSPPVPSKEPEATPEAE